MKYRYVGVKYMHLMTANTGYPVYMLQAKTKGKACAHVLPRATTAPEFASLLREGSDAATCPKTLDPHLCLGGVWCYHVSQGSRPYTSA
jgi:hypothetical protein